MRIGLESRTMAHASSCSSTWSTSAGIGGAGLASPGGSCFLARSSTARTMSEAPSLRASSCVDEFLQTPARIRPTQIRHNRQTRIPPPRIRPRHSSPNLPSSSSFSREALLLRSRSRRPLTRASSTHSTGSQQPGSKNADILRESPDPQPPSQLTQRRSLLFTPLVLATATYAANLGIATAAASAAEWPGQEWRGQESVRQLKENFGVRDHCTVLGIEATVALDCTGRVQALLQNCL